MTDIPSLEALFSAERNAIDALLQFIGARMPLDRHKQFVDSYALQQCLLQLTDDRTSTDNLLATVNNKLEALETLSPRQAAAIYCCDELTRELLRQPVFDVELATVLTPLARKIAASAIDGNGWLYNRDHPLHELINRLCQFACGWHSGLGRSGESAKQFLQQLIGNLQLDWQVASDTLDEWLHNEQQRIQKLEQRLIASEVGTMKARRSKQLTIKTLNQLVSGKQLPQAGIDFIQGPWLQSLQLAVVQQGERSELWFRQRKLTETLIWSLQPIKDEAHRQQLFRVIGQLGEELRATLISLDHQPESKDDVLATIEHLHLQLIQNNSVDYCNVAPLENHDPLLVTGTSISRSLLAKVETLQTGIWFDFPHQAQRRLKLLIKDDESQQLLFVNQLGIKSLEQSFEEFAYQLASAGAVLLSTENLFTQIWQTLLGQWHAEFSKAAEQEARSAAEQRIKIAAEQRARELARLKAEEEAARLLAAKQLADKQRLDAELAARELAEQQHRDDLLAHESVNQAAQQRARLIASSLTIGAWMEYRNPRGETEKLKLAVILPTSGKCIFVDRNGIKKLELMRNELIASIYAGHLILVNSGQQFEDTLARVVGGLRKDRNG